MRGAGLVRRHGWSAAVTVMVLLGFALLLVMLVTTLDQRAQLNASEARSTRQGAQIDALSSGLATTERQLLAHGISPSAPPPQVIISGVPGASGPTGQQGPGPSDAQVAAGVAAYLALHPVPGVSNAQIAAAVTAHLVASPPPSGPQGPGPSDQQIAVAVASYMAANPAPSGPSGPPGADGKDGVDGSPGPKPGGWSFDAGGVAYNCVPDDGTPAPHYTCPPVSPSASSSGSPSASATGLPTDSPSPTPTPAVPTSSPAAPNAPGATVTSGSAGAVAAIAASPRPPGVATTAPAPAPGSGPSKGALLLGMDFAILGRREQIE